VRLAANEIGAGVKLTSPEDVAELIAEVEEPLAAGVLVAIGATTGFGVGLAVGFATGF